MCFFKNKKSGDVIGNRVKVRGPNSKGITVPEGSNTIGNYVEGDGLSEGTVGIEIRGSESESKKNGLEKLSSA